jgi:hypothetical protein
LWKFLGLEVKGINMQRERGLTAKEMQWFSSVWREQEGQRAGSGLGSGLLPSSAGHCCTLPQFLFLKVEVIFLKEA